MAKAKKNSMSPAESEKKASPWSTLSEDELISRVFDSFSLLGAVPPSDIPRIDLYMDQVTTFMEQHLHNAKRRDEDKILTKTMINNYAKNKLLPPPDKKKYSGEHMLLLVFIYYFKSVLPLQDIQAMLGPLCEHYFKNTEGINIQSIYDEVFRISEEDLNHMREEVLRLHKSAYSRFADAPEADKDFLRFFTLITYLLLDVYMKKNLISSLIDDYLQSED